MTNLLLYSAQIALLAACGWLISLAPSMRAPRTAHRHWRLLLLVCLLLPFASPRRAATSASNIAGVSFSSTAGVTVTGTDWSLAIAALLALGVTVFLSRLAISLWRIRGWHRRSQPLRCSTGYTQFRLSTEVKGPVTFGWRRPVVLLPAAYLEMPEAQRRAIDAHELLHVRRHDWLHLLTEELVRSVLWFHPAIWFVLNRIHLSREQVVDEAAVEITGDREAYLAALLAVAGLRTELAFVPATAFLHKRHLALRVAALIRHDRPNVRWYGVAAAVLLLAASAMASSLMPLRIPAKPAFLRIGGNQQSQKLVRRLRPVYPPEAKASRIQGTVRLSVIVGKDGRVAEIDPVAGHPLLLPAALNAVRHWEYRPTLLNGEPVPIATVVDVNFTLLK